MKRKVVGLLLASLMLMNTTVYFAEVTESGDVTAGDTNNVQVVATVDASYTVTIPKKITLAKNFDGNKHGSNYSVKVQGDIAGNKKVVVEPSETTFDMSQSGKSNVTATVSGGTMEFACADIVGSGKTIDTGKITTAEALSSGDWLGNFNLVITLANAN